MYILKAERRDAASKSKQLRRNGLIPAVLYGKHLGESIMIQLSQGDTELFLRSNSVGSRLELEIDGEKHQTMLKDLSRTAITGKPEHLGFLELKKGEKVNGIASIIIIGKEQAQRQGMLLQMLSEINYTSIPSHMIDKIEVNVENLNVNENLKVADLDIAKNPNIELITSADSVVVTLNQLKKQVDTTVSDESENTGESQEESVENS